MHTPGAGISGYALMLLVQIIFLIVYAVYVRYEDKLLPTSKDSISVNVEEELFEKKHVPSYPRKLHPDFFLSKSASFAIIMEEHFCY